MRFFQKKYKTDSDGRTYTMRWSTDWMRKNPWQSGVILMVSLFGRTFGFSIKLTNSYALPKQGGGLRQVFQSPEIELEAWHGRCATVVRILPSKWRKSKLKWINKQTYSIADFGDYVGLLATTYIKDFSLGTSVDFYKGGHSSFYLGFLTIRRFSQIWNPGFNDHEFPTTPYGKYVCSLSRKEKKQFLAVERALKGSMILRNQGDYSITLTAIRSTTGVGISPSIPSLPQAFPASFTTFIQS